MKAMEKDWYQKNWTLDIQNMSWVEDTSRQVDFLIKQLQLKGTEKILDLACGFGRHSLEFARRGYDVTGIDITPAYIDYANEQAKEESLNAKFFCQDIRTITFDKEFDVVLNMAYGAIGYLEDDEENHKIFSVIAKALKKGGKHFMDIMNGSYAETHFPCKLWDAGEKGLTLSAFENCASHSRYFSDELDAQNFYQKEEQMFDIFLCIWYTIFMKKDMFTINKNGFSYPASRKELWGEHL